MNYLALFRRTCSLKIRSQTFSVPMGERNAIFWSLLLDYSFSRASVSNASVLRFVKMMAIIEIIDATDSLLQNIIRIFCLC